jgi:peptide/nickel transport system permease protein
MSATVRRFLGNPKALFGLTILAIVILAALFAPVLFPRDPWQMATRPFLPPFQNVNFWLGTDMLGRDILAGLVYGGQVSLIVGLVSTLVAVGVGILFGALAGYYGGVIDDALMRITEFFQTIPTFVFALVLVAILSPSVASIILRSAS